MNLHPITLAVRTYLGQVRSEARERSRRLVEAAHAGLRQQMDRDLNAALKKAVETHLGQTIDDPSTLIGRLAHGLCQNPPGTIYQVDGVSVLWVGHPKPEVIDGKLHVERPTRQLVSGPAGVITLDTTP